VSHQTCVTCDLSKEASRTKSSGFSWRKDRQRYYVECKLCRNSYQRDQRPGAREKAAIAARRHKFLAGGILERAILDWKRYGDPSVVQKDCTDHTSMKALAKRRGHATVQDELLTFLRSPFFDELAEMADSDGNKLRRLMDIPNE